MFDHVTEAKSRLELWTSLVRQLKPATMLELGVWNGNFAAHLLAECPSIRRYYMIDPWRPLPAWNKPLNVSEGVFEQAFKTTVGVTRFAADRIEILRGTTREVVGRIPDASLDFAYVDGDHTLRGISIDLIGAYPKVRSGGYLGGDDFDWNIWQHGPEFEPTLVFPFAVYFAEAVGARIHALPFGQFIIEKPLAPDGEFAFVDHTQSYEDTSLRALMLDVQRRDSVLRRIIRKLRKLAG